MSKQYRRLELPKRTAESSTQFDGSNGAKDNRFCIESDDDEEIEQKSQSPAKRHLANHESPINDRNIPSQSNVTGVITQLRENFQTLRGSPTELYVNFVLKFFTSYSYFAVSQILVIYLHDEFGASDVQAGTIYGMWGLCITFWGLCSSWLNDNLGVRNSLLVGFVVSIIASLIMTITTSLSVIYIVLFLIMPIGTSMGIPMLTVGIKRYTTARNRGFAFGLYYSVMNIAAFVSGPVVDGFNIGLKHGVEVLGVHWSGNRLVILSTFVANICSLLITYYYLREIRVQIVTIELTAADASVNLEDSTRNPIHSRLPTVERTLPQRKQRLPTSVAESNVSHSRESFVDAEDEKDDTSNGEHLAQLRNLTASPLHSASAEASAEAAVDLESNGNTIVQQGGTQNAVESYQPEQKSLCKTGSELLYSATFWRFVVLTLFLINLKAIFRHLDATLPTYLIRCFGSQYPKGIIYSINPFMIMWLTPVVAAMTTNYAHYDMIKYGGYLTGLSPFFLAMDTSTWAVVMFVVSLSLGEAIWSPRTYDYTMSIAPEGREASFSALAAAPLFAAKVPVGLLSGYLISKYLPEGGDHPDGQTLWLIIGLLTISSPICVTLFERCIREPTAETAETSVPLVEKFKQRILNQRHQPLVMEDRDSNHSEDDRTPSPDSVSDNDSHTRNKDNVVRTKTSDSTTTGIVTAEERFAGRDPIDSLRRYNRKVAEGDVAYRLQGLDNSGHGGKEESIQ